MDQSFIFTMFDKVNSSNITEFEYTDGTKRLVLRKTGTLIQVPAGGETLEEHSVRLGISANPIGGVSGKEEKIKSPIVATYYSAPNPDSPPFVKPGSKVKAGQTLCILEAMKMMNHLEAEFDCEIVSISVSSGELVEYGQELFIIKRS